jgi:hypothetical protein
MSMPPVPPADTGALALSAPAPRSSGGLLFWGILWGCAGGLVDAVGLILLGAVYRQDALLMTQVDVGVVNTVSTIVVAMCLVIPSLLASIRSRNLASGIIAGALVIPVTLALSSLFYALAFGAQMIAGPEVAITVAVGAVVGAGIGLICGGLGALIGRRFAQRTR